MVLTGWAAERLAKMTPDGHRAVIHVSLTDDHPWAQGDGCDRGGANHVRVRQLTLLACLRMKPR